MADPRPVSESRRGLDLQSGLLSGEDSVKTLRGLRRNKEIILKSSVASFGSISFSLYLYEVRLFFVRGVYIYIPMVVMERVGRRGA